tara:strand:+ start:13274 stop:14302 length:1029 start_codon:yes stop_codon:yes gene_type:complete
MNFKKIFKGKNKYPILIAEIGINHNGSIKLAKEMILKAKSAGADVVKFQTHIVDKEMLRDKPNKGKASHLKNKSLYDIMEECSFNKESHKTLIKFAKKNNVLFLSTPFSIEAVDMLYDLKVDAYKIGSGETNNYDFINYVLSKKKPTFISTGTSSIGDINKFKKRFYKFRKNIILMHCTSNYPTKYIDANVGYMTLMKKKFNNLVGFSDHSTGNYASFAAVALGANIIERHFTISRKLPGIDQSSSSEPHEFFELRKGINSIYDSLGYEKKVNEEAKLVIKGFSQSIVSIKDIQKGDKLIPKQNIWYKRPGTGIPSNKIKLITGKRAKKKIQKDKLLNYKDF